MVRNCNRLLYGLILAVFLSGCGQKMDNSGAVSGNEISDTAPELALVSEEPDIEEEEPKEEHDDTISIVMIGDVLLHDGINKTCRNEDGTYDYSGLFKNISNEIEESDIAIVNQEVIIGGRELGVTGYPSFNAPYEIADDLASVGFDVVCHANNHVYDRGETGLVNCITYWRENHPNVMIVGLSDSQCEEKTYIIEKKGIRVAVLNYTYGTNGVNISGGDRYSVNKLDRDRVIKDLKKAEEEADFTIVCPHWGIEYDLEPSDEQREWARVFMENGADLVIGTHPHVIQPVEWIEDEVNGQKMLIYYSLGNFVNWTAGKGQHIGYRLVGGMARVRVGHDTLGGVTIIDHNVEAIVTHLDKSKEKLTVYRLNDYIDRLAGSNEILKNDTSFSKEYCLDLCNKVWGDEWK